VARVQDLAHSERKATAQLVAHLSELDARKLYLGAGFPSLFTYCCEILRLSEAEAYNRIEAARAAQRLAGRFPRPDIPSSLRKLPVPAGGLERTASSERPAPSTLVAPPAPPRRPLVTPLATDRFALQFTVNTATRDKLRLAQDLLRHAIPTGDTAQIFDRALTLLLADLACKKFGATTRPRQSTLSGTSSVSR
jgi:hypothetical protein